MTKPKILILNSSAIYGGGEYFVLKLATALKLRGYTLTVGCRGNNLLSKKLSEAGIKTVNISFPERGSGDLKKTVKEVRKVIRDEQINIVHSNTGYDRTAGAFAARGTNAVHVTSCHSLEPISHNITHFIRNRFLTRHFIADGESIKKLIEQKNNIPSKKITVIHNGINPEEMSRDSLLRKEIRAEFGLKDNEALIGSVGRLVEFKGYKYLLTAFKIIVEKIPDAKLIIVGDGELMESLKAQARTLKINERVIFTGFRDDLKAVYSAFDMYVNSSIEGGGELFPFSVLYAMAQGLPIVAAKVGDIPEMIQDNENGFLVPERSPYKIAEKVLELVNNPDLFITYGKTGRLMLNEKFTLEKMTDKIVNVYINAINRGK